MQRLEAQIAQRRGHAIEALADWTAHNASAQELIAVHRWLTAEDLSPEDATCLDALFARAPQEILDELRLGSNVS